MSFFTKLSNQFFKITTLALFVGLGMGDIIQALPCQGLPGNLTPINKGELLSSSTVNVVESYECVVNINPPYGLADDLRCFVVTGGTGNPTFSQSDNKVYQIEPDGSLTEIQTGWNTGADGENLGASIADIAPFKCEGNCYIAVVENPSGVILIYSVLSDGTLQPATSFITGTSGLTTVDAFECNGVCYIITGGDDPLSHNLLLNFLPPASFPAGVSQNYDLYNTINDVVAFECEGIWWVVTGSDDPAGSNLYQLDPCALTDPLVFRGNYSPPGEVIALTAYFWNCQWYVSTLQHIYGAFISDNVITYVLDLNTASLTQVDMVGAALDTAPWTSITSYACGCECYVATGGTTSSHNIVFRAVDTGTAFSLTFNDFGFNNFGIASLTSYDCCQCYVVSVGPDQYGASNQVFRVHDPQVVANNDCFCIEENSYAQVLSIFDNDCGCIDTSTATFYRDEALTDLIGGPTDFTTDINPGEGTLSWDQNNGTLTYTPPATIDELLTVCFFYTIEDCCNCSDCAKVTIFLKPDSEYLCDVEMSAVSNEENCSGDDGQISVTVSGGLGPYDYAISPDPGYQSMSNVTSQNFVFTGLAAGDYLVTVTDILGCQDWELVTVGLDNVIEIVEPLYGEDQEFCTTDYPISLFATPTDGVWSGTGVTDLGYGAGIFDPGLASAGLHTITYTSGLCTASFRTCVAVCSTPFPFRVTNRGFVPLEVKTAATLIACRDKAFCYEITVTNTDPNQDSGIIQVFGLVEPDWIIDGIFDCTTEPDTPYENQGGNLWVNPLDNNISFIQDMNDPEGLWTIGVLTPGESICLKICATDPDVGNKTLNIRVVQS